MKKLTKKQKLDAINKSLIHWGEMEKIDWINPSYDKCALCQVCDINTGSDACHTTKCRPCPVNILKRKYKEPSCTKWCEDDDAGPAIIALSLLKAMIETDDA
jgi:ferredoxin